MADVISTLIRVCIRQYDKVFMAGRVLVGLEVIRNFLDNRFGEWVGVFFTPTFVLVW